MEEKKYYLEEESYVLLHSGEIPEVALHGSLYYLTEDQDGPGLELDRQDLQQLMQHVVTRYCEIMRRDLDPANRDKSIYRGLKRCVANWQRLKKFCRQEHLDLSSIKDEMRDRLHDFLHNEAGEVHTGTRTSSINCSVDLLQLLITDLGLSGDSLPANWQALCRPE